MNVLPGLFFVCFGKALTLALEPLMLHSFDFVPIELFIWLPIALETELADLRYLLRPFELVRACAPILERFRVLPAGVETIGEGS